jgi:hypothetical protein
MLYPGSIPGLVPPEYNLRASSLEFSCLGLLFTYNIYATFYLWITAHCILIATQKGKWMDDARGRLSILVKVRIAFSCSARLSH